MNIGSKASSFLIRRLPVKALHSPRHQTTAKDTAADEVKASQCDLNDLPSYLLYSCSLFACSIHDVIHFAPFFLSLSHPNNTFIRPTSFASPSLSPQTAGPIQKKRGRLRRSYCVPPRLPWRTSEDEEWKGACNLQEGASTRH